jgi:hypothetical protein
MSDTATEARQSSSTTEQVKERVGDGAQQIQEKASEAKGRLREEVRNQVDSRSTETGQKVSSTASALRQTAQQLRGDQQQQQAEVLERIAEQVERLGRYLNETDGDRLLRDVEQFTRRRPWVIAGGGLVLGFFGARLTKASSGRRYQQQSNGTAQSRVVSERPAALPSRTSSVPSGGDDGGI